VTAPLSISFIFLCILLLVFIFYVFYHCDAQQVGLCAVYAVHYKCLIIIMMISIMRLKCVLYSVTVWRSVDKL